MKKTILLVSLALLGLNNANAQVGIGTENPDASAELDVFSTEKGFLPPRMTITERRNISSPAVGLVIYNTSSNCMEIATNQRWKNLCNPNETSTGEDFTDGFEGNTTCNPELISVTSCASVAGASLNDDPNTGEGTEYDWSEAGDYMSGGTTQALVEINGQCWFTRNTNAPSTAPVADEPGTGGNVWGATLEEDEGYWGYYNTADNNSWGTTEPATGEGLRYQWSAAMNGETAERSQGVCPDGWHIPSDCEWSYLENNLGMGTGQQQQGSQWRNVGSVGLKLSDLTFNGSGTNASGFNGLLSGYRVFNGLYDVRTVESWFWSSTSDPNKTNHAWMRKISVDESGVYRFSYRKARAMAVRCLRD